MFGEFKNEYTLAPTLNLAAFAGELGASLPDPHPFVKISPRRWWNAWGKPFAWTELQKLLSK